LFIGAKSRPFLNDFHVYARNLMRQEEYLKKKTNKNLKDRCDDCLKKHQVNANIEELNDCTSSEIYKEVIKESQQLNHLNLSGCFKITDLSLKFVFFS
jgi:hypothetical protein